MKVKGNIEFTIKEHSESIVISEMPMSEGIKNPFGVAHAGAILWFTDVAATVLVMGGAEVEEGMQGFPLAINLNANLASNQTSGEFIAKSEFIKTSMPFFSGSLLAL